MDWVENGSKTQVLYNISKPSEIAITEKSNTYNKCCHTKIVKKENICAEMWLRFLWEKSIDCRINSWYFTNLKKTTVGV